MTSYDFNKFCENKQNHETLILEKFESICQQIAMNGNTVKSFFQEVVMPILASGQASSAQELLDIMCENTLNEGGFTDFARNMKNKVSDKAAKWFGNPFKDPQNVHYGTAGTGKAPYNAFDDPESVIGKKSAGVPAAQNPAQQKATELFNSKLPDIKKEFISQLDSITKNVMDKYMSSSGEDKEGSRISWIAAKGLGGQLKTAIQNWNPKTTFSGKPTGYSSALQQHQGDEANVDRRLSQMNRQGQTPAAPAQPPQMPQNAEPVAQSRWPARGFHMNK